MGLLYKQLPSVINGTEVLGWITPLTYLTAGDSPSKFARWLHSPGLSPGPTRFVTARAPGYKFTGRRTRYFWCEQDEGEP